MDSERTAERRSPLRVILIVIAAILVVPFVLMAVMMPMMWMGGGMWTGSAVSMSPLWGVGMMLAFLLIVLGGGYALYRVLTRADMSRRDPALEELRVAYARGELSREEFEQRKDVLEETNQ
jgi:putative membrane protein